MPPASQVPAPDTPGAIPLRIVAVTRKPTSASFEHRIRRHRTGLAAHGIEVVCRTLPHGFLAQWRFLAMLSDADAVWWHRHLLVPGLVGQLRRNARRLVFEFDDPIWCSSRGGGRPSLSRRLRVAAMLRRMDGAFAASDYLAQQARQYCPTAHVIPMAVDLPQVAPEHRGDEQGVELLWLGSETTQSYLELIRPALTRLGDERSDVRLRLIAHRPMAFGNLPVDFRPWSRQDEQAALEQCHVGLCPMPDTIWTCGKCPYKVLQYMAWGMPWVGSAVGQNVTAAGGTDIDRANGLCATIHEQWLAALSRLANEPALRAAMGRRGRAFIQQSHDRGPLTDRLSQLWRDLAEA